MAQQSLAEWYQATYRKTAPVAPPPAAPSEEATAAAAVEEPIAEEAVAQESCIEETPDLSQAQDAAETQEWVSGEPAPQEGFCAQEPCNSEFSSEQEPVWSPVNEEIVSV